jgi:hypothetical protein
MSFLLIKLCEYLSPTVFIKLCIKNEHYKPGRNWWFMPIILSIQEAEIWKITVQSHTRQIVHETLTQKNPQQKMAGGVAQGIGPEFKPQYHKKRELQFTVFNQKKVSCACYVSV